MNYFILSLILFILGVGGIIGFMIWVRSLEYTNIKSSDDCDKEGSPKNAGDKCGAWDDPSKTCWRGKLVIKSGKNECEKHSQPGAAALAIASAICILLSIIFLIVGFVHHHKAKNQSSSGLPSSSTKMNFW
jgi:hypothetical protein